MINYQLSLRLAAFQTQTVIDSWKQKRQKCFQAHLEREVMWICVCRDHVSTASSRAEQHSIFTVQSKSCFFFVFFYLFSSLQCVEHGDIKDCVMSG